MLKFKKLVATSLATLVICSMSLTVFASDIMKTPCEVAASVTGKTVESVLSERTESGKTYDEIAEDAGKLDEYTTEVLKLAKADLDAEVKAKRLTQDEADLILADIEALELICDGTRTGCVGGEYCTATTGCLGSRSYHRTTTRRGHHRSSDYNVSYSRGCHH